MEQKSKQLFGNQGINITYIHSMDFHIGKKINEVRKERGWQTTALAKKVNRSRETLHEVYNRTSIDTQLLIDLSEVLQYNFFKDFVKQPLVDQWNHEEITNAVNDPAAITYGANYKDKYLEALEENHQLRKDKEQLLKQSEQSFVRTQRAGFAKTVAALELIIENQAEVQNKSVAEQKAAWSIKTNALLKADIH
jgi:transcriptional regulator with XRE-family HTH domain